MSKTASTEKRLRTFYGLMAAHHGPTHWWPGDTPFEIAIGAILTQNTAWSNVEKAIHNLKQRKLLTPRTMLACTTEEMEDAIRPSGYFRQKTQRLFRFARFLMDEHRGSLKRLAQHPLPQLREELLALNGIGPETADDILLYACRKPVFVVDAYTRRIFSRHGLVDPNIGYEELRAFFEDNLPPDLDLFSEYHGLIVWTGKDFCRKTPQCEGCPLAPMLRRGQPVL